MAAWRAALVVGTRAPLRGRLLGPRPARSQRRPPGWRMAAAAALLGGGSVAACCGGWGPPGAGAFLTVLAQKEDVANAEMAERLSLRKNRFMHFASLEYEGEYYMTPRDFLFSVMFDQVQRKSSAKKLTKKEVDAALLCVTKAKPGPTFFRELGDKEPQTGFQIAFKMLDTDGNEQVEKKEFFKMQRIIGKEDDLKTAGDETVFQEAELESCGVNTMLLVHFFGKEGKEKLRYSEFFRFMENLQTEVQEMEFIQFSKGLNVMRKEDFAEWLLYFTDEENNEIYWQNVKDRFEAGENISLEEFKTFCKFTNNLEDFSIAMQMFTVANRPVKRAEFKRAVKVATGQELSDNILDTIFKIFDLDGDDCLSHSEFLGVLKKRIHRGLRVPQQQGIQGYWKCVKRESIKGAKELWKQSGKSPF
ncbi:calcium uptake protein 2, mitochondrial isoform X2 [Tympanuchus pallidicinctus]|uniref:calcium uptake protein 2, mitochondrial isoform X2 n=1 Tax=Tympanuchus pallidicinctus TaxID=109042 RepID=UPI002286D903|nr:calcium uptake protein 2, mitochondrial isoform X2 [Tympanuchus pallidicinctus]